MRLLLAEDEPALSRALVTILERNHFSVDPVYNGKDALAYLEAENYDGAILDIMMPEMDGIQVLKEIREKGSRIPVLLLTAKAQVDDKVLGLDAGANDYLTKPFDTRELLARIRAMCRTQTGQGEAQLRFGNVVLSQVDFTLSGPGGSFRLANREYQMMEMLMANPKSMLSSEQFIQKIWGYDSDAESSVVWVYISYLRKKLTALQADVKISSARNVGYYLEKII